MSKWYGDHTLGRLPSYLDLLYKPEIRNTPAYSAAASVLKKLGLYYKTFHGNN
jgi:hypothetical protein